MNKKQFKEAILEGECDGHQPVVSDAELQIIVNQCLDVVKEQVKSLDTGYRDGSWVRTQIIAKIESLKVK